MDGGDLFARRRGDGSAAQVAPRWPQGLATLGCRRFIEVEMGKLSPRSHREDLKSTRCPMRLPGSAGARAPLLRRPCDRPPEAD